jgi:hypothetical protein
MSKFILPLVGIEDYLWAMINLHLVKHGHKLHAAILSGDLIEGYASSLTSLTMLLQERNKKLFYLNFDGHQKIMNILKDPEFLRGFIPYFIHHYSLEESIIHLPIRSSEAFVIIMDIDDEAGNSYPLLITISQEVT